MLTTVEEFLLLALDGRTGDFRRISTEYLHAGLIGAAVMELALMDRIDSDVDRAWVIDPSPTGDAALDSVLAGMTKPGFPPEPDRMIERLMPLAEIVQDNTLARLCARGVLERSEARSLLLKKVTRHVVKDGQDFEETRGRLRQLLTGDGLPDSRDVCLITLAKTCGLLDQLIAAHEMPAAMDRVSSFAGLDLIGQNVRRYLYLFERDLTG
jgi:golgi phosphoprotein 3